MRWFILLLILANLGLFFWLQHESLSEQPVAMLLPHDIGRLELLPTDTRDASEEQIAPVVEESPALTATLPIESTGLPSEAPIARVEGDTATESDRPTVKAESEAVQENPVPSDPPVYPPEPIMEAIDQPVETTTVSPERAIDEIADPKTRTDPPEIAAEQPLATDEEAMVDSPEEQAVAVGPEAIEAAPVVVPATVEQKLAEPPDVGVLQPDPVTAVCAQVGPLTAEQAERLVAQLPVFITLLSDIAEEVRTVDAYYVMTPALGSRAEALQMLKALENDGITDTWLFPRGRFRNAISLGLFSRQSGALRWQEEVVSRGFDARVVERSTKNERRHLLLQNVDGSDIALSLPLPDGAKAEPQPCP